MNKSIKNTINNILMKTKFTIQEESIMVGVVVYKTVTNIIGYNSDAASNMLSLVEQYVNTYKSIISSMNRRYISYVVMKQKIQNYNIMSFLDVNEVICNELYNLYLDKTEMVLFSSIKYSSAMYNISDMSWTENQRLSNIHFNIMVPLVKYCIDKYNIKEEDVNIYSVIELSDNPGKGILFDITGVNSNSIINDMFIPSLGLSGKIYNATVYDNKCLLILK